MKYVKHFESFSNLITEDTSNNNLYFSDTDTYGVLIYEDDSIVKFVNVADADGEQYDQTEYTYIKNHFDNLIKNGRIRRS